MSLMCQDMLQYVNGTSNIFNSYIFVLARHSRGELNSCKCKFNTFIAQFTITDQMRFTISGGLFRAAYAQWQQLTIMRDN
jgi:hypothetical protein